MTPHDAAQAATARPGAHVIEVADDFLQQMAEQANPGYRVTLEWGEPDADGVYTPTITVHNWSQLHSEAMVRIEALADALRALVEAVDATVPHPSTLAEHNTAIAQLDIAHEQARAALRALDGAP